jgi:hypothetical protein
MRKSFDRRVVPDFGLVFVRAWQTRIPCHLGGGAALAGALTRDQLERFRDSLAERLRGSAVRIR